MLRVEVTITDTETGDVVKFPSNDRSLEPVTLPEEVTWRGMMRALRTILEVPEGADIFLVAATHARRSKMWTDEQRRVLEEQQKIEKDIRNS